MAITENKLVDGLRLLELVFDEESRPSIRWLRYQQAARTIPFLKIGGKVFFDPEQVRTALNTRFAIVGKRNALPGTLKLRGEGSV